MSLLTPSFSSSSSSSCCLLHWLITTILSLCLSLSLFLIKSQLLSTSLLPPSLPPSPPCLQSEGTGSIVIGLQSWQPYDWAVGYCNWIRLEISSVPVRLLKSQSVVPRLAPVIHTFPPSLAVNGSCCFLSEEVSLCVIVSLTCRTRDKKKWNQSESWEKSFQSIINKVEMQQRHQAFRLYLLLSSHPMKRHKNQQWVFPANQCSAWQTSIVVQKLLKTQEWVIEAAYMDSFIYMDAK